MRSALFWLLGASLAFFLTAGAFVVLANFGTTPKASDPIPSPGPSTGGSQGPELDLNFSEKQLEGLQRSQNQTLTLYLKNRSEEKLETVNLELSVYSEDTVHPRARRYREIVAGLAPGEKLAVDMSVDLSPPPPVESLAILDDQQLGNDREILEARAYAPGEAPVVKTAIVSP